MKTTIKKLLTVGTKLKVVHFHQEKTGRYSIEDKQEIIENATQNKYVQNFRIISENTDTFEFSYTSTIVPEKLDCTRSIDIVQSNAIRFNSGSWLYFGPAAQSEQTENGFKVWELDRDGKIYSTITYEFCE